MKTVSFETVSSQTISSDHPLIPSPRSLPSYTRNNDRCYIVPNLDTEQYRQSFFPRTIAGWNKLNNNKVHSGRTEAFK